MIIISGKVYRPIVVECWEAIDHNWDGECHDEDPGQRTKTSEVN